MDRQSLERHLTRLLDSHLRLTGRELIPRTPGTELSAAIDAAGIVLLSHGTEADPILNYGNRLALELWEMDWKTFTSMPSRLTAEPADRDTRERFMADVRSKGYSDDYKGIRISRTGRRFRIEQAVVWNVADERGAYVGQAASFPKWSYVDE